MENTSQPMELEDIEVDVDDDTLTIIPTPGTVEFGSTKNKPNQPVNIVSPTLLLLVRLGLGMEVA
jgi:hypothetical protein